MNIPLRSALLTVLLSGAAGACDAVPLGLAQQTVLAAERNGLPPAVLLALVCAESSFRIDAVSEAGAIGLGQLMPGTARELGVNPWDPVQNLSGAARYLAQQLRTFGGQWPLALAAYHAGAGTVQAYGGVPPLPKTQAYVAKVLQLTPRFDASWRAWVAPLAIPAARPLPVVGTVAARPTQGPVAASGGRAAVSSSVAPSAVTGSSRVASAAPAAVSAPAVTAPAVVPATAHALVPAAPVSQPAPAASGMALTRATPAPVTGSGSRLALADPQPPVGNTP